MQDISEVPPTSFCVGLAGEGMPSLRSRLTAKWSPGARCGGWIRRFAEKL